MFFGLFRWCSFISILRKTCVKTNLTNPYGVYITDEDRNYFSGSVGIGSAAPAAKLDIAATGDGAALLKFTTDGETYTIEYRGSRYVFESDKEIRFYFDSSDKIYNNLTGKVVKDRIIV